MNHSPDANPPPGATGFGLIWRNSFKRLFENDLLPEDVDLSESLSWLVPMAAAPAMMIGLWLIPKYTLLAQIAPDTFELATWPDKTFFIIFSMGAVGLLTVCVWDCLFPDDRDIAFYGVLPVPTWHIVAGRLVAIGMLVGGFAAAINIGPAMVFAFAAAGTEGTFSSTVRHLVSHLLATITAGGFVFASLAALQILMAATLSARVLRIASVVVQFVFIIFVVEWLVFAPGILSDLKTIEPMLRHYHWLPPLWFLGLYESALGTERALLWVLANRAAAAIFLTLGVTACVYAISYRRIASNVSASTRTSHVAGARSFVDRGLRLISRSPLERAVLEFAIRSVLRNRLHRFLITAYFAVGLAFVLGRFMQPLLDGQRIEWLQPTVNTLSIPLLLSFFAVVGLRVLIDVPSDLSANWIFRLTESKDKAPYLRATRKALHLLGVLPILGVTVPLFLLLWGPADTLRHSIYWLLLAGILVEIAILNLGKVPFTCSYVPGRANIKLTWPLYLLAMTVYAFSTTRLESWLLRDTSRWLVATAALVLILVGLVLYQERRRQPTRFVYQESVDTVQTLELSHRGFR